MFRSANDYLYYFKIFTVLLNFTPFIMGSALILYYDTNLAEGLKLYLKCLFKACAQMFVIQSYFIYVRRYKLTSTCLRKSTLCKLKLYYVNDARYSV